MNRIKQSTENTADIYLYGDVEADGWWSDSETSAKSFKDRLEELKDITQINLHINSLGGDVIEGIAIFNLLRQHPAKVNVYIDGFACSIASVIAMAGDVVYMPKNTMMMIHNCWSLVVGNAKEMRKTADDLDKIMETSIESYLSKVKIERDELVELLDAETWLTAEECYEKGFADVLLPLSDAVAQQSATKTIEKLLKENKQLKERAKDQNIAINLDEESINKIAEKMLEKSKEIAEITIKEMIKGSAKEEPKGLYQDSKKQNANNKTLFESFFNAIILKEENK